MRFSQSFIKTKKNVSREDDSKNARYFTRTGMTDKHMAGVYALMPLGMKVYQKIAQVIREEMVAVDGQEILMNVLQPRELWDETGRFEKMSDIFYKTQSRSGSELGLGPTHEEQVVDLVRKHINSYRDLPLSLFQIQVKFRNETRVKSGLLRGREFIMKDMYSFHIDQADFDQYYDKVKNQYLKLMRRLGLAVRATKASGGDFSQFSDEFQLLNPVGEDVVYCCEQCDVAINKEIVDSAADIVCPDCRGKMRAEKGVEVGNIFPLGDKFSRQMNLRVADEDGKDVYPVMGCYGIGLGRLMGVIVEQYFDEENNRMLWPEDVSPFAVHLISLNAKQEADNVYQKFIENGIDVLYDDRDLSAGEKMADADLIGCGRRIIVSQRSLEAGGIEMIDRYHNISEIVKVGDIEQKIFS